MRSVLRLDTIALLDAMRDGALAVTGDGDVVHANLAARLLLGRDAPRLAGVLETVAPLVPGRWAATLTRSDGARIAVRLNVVPGDGLLIVVIHEGRVEHLAVAAEARSSAMHRAVVGIAEAVDAYLFSGEMMSDGYYVGAFRGPGAARLLGGAVPEEQLDGTWDARVHPDDYALWSRSYDEAVARPGHPAVVEYRLLGLDGITRWIRERAVARVLPDGRTMLDGVALDVSAERSVAAQFERIFALTNDLIIAYDRRRVIRIVNPAVAPLLGYLPDEVVGREWAFLVHPDDREADYALGEIDFAQQSATPVVVRVVTKAGETRHFSWTGAYDAEDDLMLYVGRDLTADVEHTIEIERRSRTDVLTGLSNRRHLVESLVSELGRADRQGSAPGVILIDIDRFKVVNDTHGHTAGDVILVEVARRLRSAIRAYDIAGRWGGEEFCVIVPDVPSDDALRAVADNLRLAVSAAPIGVGAGDLLLNVEVSAGAVRAGPGLWTVEGIVDAADRALYSAKRRGRGQTRLFRELTVEDLVAEEPEALRLAQALALSAGVREGIPETHPAQVSDLAGRTARALGLTESDVMRCRLAGWLHDLGKIAIPDEILGKPGPLDAAEWGVMRGHAATGAAIVARVAGLAGAAPAVRHHHERVDGTGYPDRLVGDEIPLEARIVACADAYSAITANRAYRAASSHDDAIAELRASAGTHLDPVVVEALVAVLGDPALAFDRR
jgi:diguanylate cyclase (GGDEF)-like protein/PAS domain S-box-containing protein